MSVVAAAFFLLSATAAGFGVVRLVSSGLSRAETLAWSFAAGWLVQAAAVLGILAARGIPGPKKILGIEVLLLAASFAWRPRIRTRRSPPVAAHAPGVILWLATILAGAGVVLFAATALSAPMEMTDFLAIWGLKGKTIFVTSSIPARLFHDRAFEWDHPEYPLGIPLAFAALAAAMRGWDDRALALLYPATQIATVLVLWGFLRRRVSAEAGAVAGALCALCLPLYSRGNVGTAEIPVAFAFVLAATAILEAREDRSHAALARLAAASLFCASIKQEAGLFLLLASAVLLVLDRRRAWPAAAAAAFPIAGHALFLRMMRGPVARRDYDLTLLEPRRWEELVSNGGVILRRLASVEIPHALVALAVVGLFLLATGRGVADWLLLPIAAQVAIYAALGTVSAFGPLWLVAGSFSRITMALVPVLLLALAARLADFERSAA
jgi:hypothetical protein